MYKRNNEMLRNQMIKSIVANNEWCDEKQATAMISLYDYLFSGWGVDDLQRNIDNDYITINKGRNGKMYAWYLYEDISVVCEVETLEITENEQFIEKQFC